jgi:hypothetical protein
MEPQVPRRGTTRSKPKEAGKSIPAAASAVSAPEEIAKLAYSYWEARGGNGGSAEEDWYRAEQEFLVRSLAAGHR